MNAATAIGHALTRHGLVQQTQQARALGLTKQAWHSYLHGVDPGVTTVQGWLKSAKAAGYPIGLYVWPDTTEAIVYDHPRM